jgi:hypothetical protein
MRTHSSTIVTLLTRNGNLSSALVKAGSQIRTSTFLAAGRCHASPSQTQIQKHNCSDWLLADALMSPTQISQTHFRHTNLATQIAMVLNHHSCAIGVRPEVNDGTYQDQVAWNENGN